MTDNQFSTKDLHFAAFLKLKGAELADLERSEGSYRMRTPVYFIFNDLNYCKHLEDVFWNEADEELVQGNIKEYVDTVRELRARTSSV